VVSDWKDSVVLLQKNFQQHFEASAVPVEWPVDPMRHLLCANQAADLMGASPSQHA
jgi:hypothetical protein